MLKDKEIDVTCMDASEEMVKRTQSLGFNSIHSTFEQMNFEDNSFDGVWAYTSLLHVSKEEMIEAIKKIHKLLKPDGIFLIGMIEGEFEGDVERESMPNTARYFRYYKSEELKEVVESLGFEFHFEDRYTPHSKTYLNQIYIKS